MVLSLGLEGKVVERGECLEGPQHRFLHVIVFILAACFFLFYVLRAYLTTSLGK